MSDIKIGDRVEVIDEKTCFCGQTVKVVEGYGEFYDHRIQFKSGEFAEIDSEDLKKVSPSFDNLLVGDIIIDDDNDNDGAKVLEVGVNTFTRSFWSNFDEASEIHTFQEAKNSGWKVKGQETEETEELTMEQVCKELGRTVKIKK